MKEKISCIIVGGSIAGSVTANLLSRLGIKVTILERSLGELKGQGAGIVLPAPLIKKCIELNLFDKNIPHLPIEGRSFFRKSPKTYQEEKIWDQSLQAVALNWMDVYHNLRKRLHSVDFQPSANVTKIQKEADGHYHLKTASGVHFDADIVIAADGVESTIRQQLLPESTERYAGYIAWRGVLENTSLQIDKHVLYYVFPNGHILFYRIPVENYAQSRKTLLNWVMYELTPTNILPLRLTDSQNIRHTRSIPPKKLHETQRQYLHQFARQQLPSMIADIICTTPHPFIQAVFDAQIQPYEDNQLIFMGDAACVLRPHSSSGVMKALSQAIDLYEFVKKNQNLSQWKNLQQKNNALEIEKANAVFWA